MSTISWWSLASSVCSPLERFSRSASCFLTRSSNSLTCAFSSSLISAAGIVSIHSGRTISSITSSSSTAVSSEPSIIALRPRTPTLSLFAPSRSAASAASRACFSRSAADTYGFACISLSATCSTFSGSSSPFIPMASCGLSSSSDHMRSFLSSIATSATRSFFSVTRSISARLRASTAWNCALNEALITPICSSCSTACVALRHCGCSSKKR
mmetsp:Transcript_79466/g.192400  ORF Transcript_79466/g.192400 Transcript_79466/m.192400 type:complete len:213 (+) Transcript_79466:1638-2276(+)